MTMNTEVYYAIMFVSVLNASFSQILLKKSAMKTYPSWIREYLNIYVICGYGMLFVSMFLTIFVYSGVNFLNVPIIESLGYIFVPTLSYLFFKEKISKKKAIGIGFIIAGMIVYYL